MRPEAAPIAQKPRQVPYYLQEPFKQWLDQGVQEDLLEKVPENEPITRSLNQLQANRTKAKKIKKFEWKDEIVELVIDLWQNQPLLLDASHPNYHVKEKWRNCINAVIASLDDQSRPRSESDDEGGKFAHSIGAKRSAKTAKQADSQVNQLIERAINVLDRPKETPKQQEAAKSADRVFPEMLGGMLKNNTREDFLKMELQLLIYETKYMSQNRGMQPSYYRNSGVQPGSAFHGMLGQDQNQPTFHCPSPHISTGSNNCSSRSGAEDE
eukprot:gene3924-15252_t